MMRTNKQPGFNASLLQIRTAYEQHVGCMMPNNMTYQAAAQQLIDVLGHDAAKTLILSIPNVA
jgi:hypothetical protein